MRWFQLRQAYPEAAHAFARMREEFPEDIAVDFMDGSLQRWEFEVLPSAIVAHHWQEVEGLVPLVWRLSEKLWRDFSSLPTSEIDALGLRVLMERFKAQTRAEQDSGPAPVEKPAERRDVTHDRRKKGDGHNL